MDCVDSVKIRLSIDFVGFKGLDGEGEIEIKFGYINKNLSGFIKMGANIHHVSHECGGTLVHLS